MSKSAPKNTGVGVLTVDEEFLRRALLLPDGCRIIDARVRGNLNPLVELVLAGPAMPQLSPHGVADHVSYIMQTQAPVVSHFAHAPDQKTEHRPGHTATGLHF